MEKTAKAYDNIGTLKHLQRTAASVASIAALASCLSLNAAACSKHMPPGAIKYTKTINEGNGETGPLVTKAQIYNVWLVFNFDDSRYLAVNESIKQDLNGIAIYKIEKGYAIKLNKEQKEKIAADTVLFRHITEQLHKMGYTPIRMPPPTP